MNKLEGKEASYKGLQKLVEDQKNTIELLQDEMREGFLEEGGSTFRNEISKIKDVRTLDKNNVINVLPVDGLVRKRQRGCDGEPLEICRAS